MGESAPIAVNEAARILRLSPDRVRQLADTGVLPVTRTSTGVRLFERQRVEQLARVREARADRG